MIEMLTVAGFLAVILHWSLCGCSRAAIDEIAAGRFASR
jgi:hypothetical protein